MNMDPRYLPIKPRKISDEIVEQIKSLILQGNLKPGESLPPERTLAKSLNVSRVSLREALNALQAMGLLEIQQGNRTCVRPITTRSIHDPLVSFTKASLSNFLKVFEIRKYLEIGSATLAAGRATSQEIERLEEIVQEMGQDLKKNRLGAKSDFDFHATITEATHNEAYNHIMHTVHDLLQEEMRIAWGSIFRKKDKRKKLFDQHKKLFEAIRQHDPKKAAEEALLHLSFAEQNFREGLKVEE